MRYGSDRVEIKSQWFPQFGRRDGRVANVNYYTVQVDGEIVDAHRIYYGSRRSERRAWGGACKSAEQVLRELRKESENA